jgi:biopolymer transport protein ExbD
MTIILDGDNKIYWFTGITDPKVELTNYSSEGIRKVLQEQIKSNSKLVILVKLDEGSTYKNFVDIFDELTITKPKSFALDELNDNDKAIMQKYLGVTDVQQAGLQPTGG